MQLVGRSALLWSSALSAAAAAASVAGPVQAQACFQRIDNGVDMTGWRKSTTNPHGPGNGWTVENGTFIGRQTSGQQGGILMTEKSYQDVEVVLEVKINWGCDSGLFFRTTDGNRAYQACIDHLPDSGVGGIWGESFSQELREIPYFLTNNGTAAIVAPNQNKQPIFDLAQWPTLWDPTKFNEMRARIEGNPPHMQVWVAGTKVMDFTDTMRRSEVAASGPLSIQVHGGARWTSDGTVAFKNIRVRDLTVKCDELGGGAGGGGTGGAGGGGTGGGGTGGGAATSGGGGQSSGGQAAGGNGSGVGGGAGMLSGGGASSGGAATGGSAQPTGGQSSGGQSSGGQPSGAGGSSFAGGAASGAGNAAMPSSGGIASGKGGSSGATAAPTNDAGGGCGCRVARREEGVPAALLWVLALVARVARRRRLSTGHS